MVVVKCRFGGHCTLPDGGTKSVLFAVHFVVRFGQDLFILYIISKLLRKPA